MHAYTEVVRLRLDHVVVLNHNRDLAIAVSEHTAVVDICGAADDRPAAQIIRQANDFAKT